jgi:hypothetical protein
MQAVVRSSAAHEHDQPAVPALDGSRTSMPLEDQYAKAVG